MREDIDAGVAERTLLLLRDDAREHPLHHVDLTDSTAAFSGGRVDRQDDGDGDEDGSHFFLEFVSQVYSRSLVVLSLSYEIEGRDKAR